MKNLFTALILLVSSVFINVCTVDGQNYTNNDITGEWIFVGNWSGGGGSWEGWEYGTVTFDGVGGLSGGLDHSDNSVSCTITGSYTLNANGDFTASMTCHEESHTNQIVNGHEESYTNQIVNGHMSVSKDTIIGAQIDYENILDYGNIILIKKGGSYTNDDITGEWTFVGNWSGGFWEGWDYGTVTLDGVGRLSGELDHSDNSVSCTITGSYTLNANGDFTASMTCPLFTNQIVKGHMSVSKDTIIGVQTDNNDSPGYGDITLIRNDITLIRNICTYSISTTSQSFSSDGGSGSVDVITQGDCDWTATSNDTWITITSGSNGSGSDTVNYSVSENTDTTERTGIMTIAEETFTVTQTTQTETSTDLALDIKANNSDGPITIETSKVLSVVISLSANDHAGQECDWWVLVNTPSGLQSYDLDQGFVSGLSVTYQGGVFNLGSATILNTSGLTAGTYTYYFGIDLEQDGKLDLDDGLFYYDSVVVSIIP